MLYEEIIFGWNLATLISKLIGIGLILFAMWFGFHQYKEIKRKSKMHRGRRTLRTDVAKYLKRDLRLEIQKRQQDLTKDYCQTADQEIAKKLFTLSEYESAATIFCFVSTEKEINTYPILENALAAGKRVCVPKCVGTDMTHLFQIKGLDDLEKGSYGIMEPKVHCQQISPEEVDFGIIPCLSCNVHGERLGHGGGYYDRILSDAKWPSAVLCREKIMEEKIPVTDNDVTIGIILSENDIWRV